MKCKEIEKKKMSRNSQWNHTVSVDIVGAGLASHVGSGEGGASPSLSKRATRPEDLVRRPEEAGVTDRLVQEHRTRKQCAHAGLLGMRSFWEMGVQSAS